MAALRTGFGAGPQQLTVVVTQRHLDWLAGQWADRDERIAALEAEVERLKAINDTLRSDRAWLAGLAEGAPIDVDGVSLVPMQSGEPLSELAQQILARARMSDGARPENEENEG
jgi:hypothetical protein